MNIFRSTPILLSLIYQVSQEDATLITDIRDDIKEECETIGPVKKVLIFDVSSF